MVLFEVLLETDSLVSQAIVHDPQDEVKGAYQPPKYRANDDPPFQQPLDDPIYLHVVPPVRDAAYKFVADWVRLRAILHKQPPAGCCRYKATDNRVRLEHKSRDR